MNTVSDSTYSATQEKTLGFIEHIFSASSKLEKQTNIILISLIPTFAFSQLITYILLGEYLRTKYNLNIKYLIDDNILSHCDLVNMQDTIDKELVCERCASATLKLRPLSDHFIYISDVHKISHNISQMPNFIKPSQLSKYRYCGDINFQQYEDSSIKNLEIMHTTAETLLKMYDIKTFISLRHHNVYSLSSMYSYFKNNKIHCISIDQGAFKKNALSFFSKSGDKDIVHDIYKSLKFDTLKKHAILKYLKQRTTLNSYTKSELLFRKKIKKYSKVIAIFPNVDEDAALDEFHSLFESHLQWIKEVVSFLVDTDYCIIIKAHPDEIRWKVQKSILSYIKSLYPSNNIIYLEAETDISTYSFTDIIDLALVYTGTLYLELASKNIPTLAAGNSYIIQNTFCKNLTKESYYSLLMNPNTLFDIIDKDMHNILKFAYIDFFCKDLKLSFSEKKYPYIKIDSALDLITTQKEEIAFEFIYDLIQNKHIDIEKYTLEMEKF